ncbi:MAG: hypothetical protein ACK5AZ_11315 [Bryobacteraceae bacterium]
MILLNLSRLLVAVVMVSGFLFGEQRLLVVSSEFPFQPGNKPVPKWSGGALLLLENASGPAVFLQVRDRNGTLSSTVRIAVPDAANVSIRDIARGTEGTIAATASAIDVSGRTASFLAIFSPSGEQVRIIRTSPYQPMRVAIASDGTIWTLGFVHRDPNTKIFRRFDRTGQSLASFVSESEVTDEGLAIGSVDDMFEPIGEGGVAWYSPRLRQYIELSANGPVNHISDLALPHSGQAGFATTKAGDTYVTSYGPTEWGLYRLDLNQRAWTPIREDSFAGTGRRSLIQLCGADSNSLVAWTNDGRIRFWNIGD